MQVIKYHGLGNDFVVLLAPQAIEAKPLTQRSELATAICARGFGVGADGVMWAAASDVADVKMELINSDGSIPEMCGNGIRCLAKYVVDELGHAGPFLDVETPGGVRRCVPTLGPNGRVQTVRVNMGAPSFERAIVPMTGDGSAVDVDVPLAERRFVATGVNTGNPHMVIFGDSRVQTAKRWGPELTVHPLWPSGANVEFAEVMPNGEIHTTVWERGCGLTQACGTGATAVAAAAIKRGLAAFETPITVRLPGGPLTITVETDFAEAWMDGPATEVFRATLSDQP